MNIKRLIINYNNIRTNNKKKKQQCINRYQIANTIINSFIMDN